MPGHLPTKGHIWMIQSGLQMFAMLIVAICDSPSKKYVFSVEKRFRD